MGTFYLPFIYIFILLLLFWAFTLRPGSFPCLKLCEFVDGGIPRVFVKNSKSCELFEVVDLVAD